MKKLLALILSVVLLTSLAACGGQTAEAPADAPTWQEQYDLGIKYLSEGNYEEAIIAFTAAIEIDPKQPAVYISRADAYIASGETDETLSAALADYEKAVSLEDSNAAAYLGLADVYIRMGDYEKALEVLRTGLEKSGNDASIADKIAEMEQGTISDSANNVRRKNDYNPSGQLIGFTLYEYDHLGRRCGWENWNYLQYNDEGEDILLDTPFLENSCEVTFNSQNLPERNQFYDADHTPKWYDTFVYNDKGLKTEQHRYNESGEKNCYFLFYYNEQNQRSKYEGYNPDGSMYSYWISEYDDAGNFIKETQFSADGSVQGYQTND